MTLAEKLKKIREEKNLSQAELAKKANVSQSMIAYIERGTKSPTINLASIIAEALGVKLEIQIKE